MPASLDLTRRMLVEVRRSDGDATASPVVRRYKLSRVAPHARQDPMLDRFAHLRRTFD